MNLARLGAVVLEQYARSKLVEDPDDWGSRYAFRDRCMAANILALLEAEGPDTKALLWAHNGHVQKTLRRRTCRAWAMCSTRRWARNSWSLASLSTRAALPPEASLIANSRNGRRPCADDFIEALLAATGFSLLALDLAQVPQNSAVAAWMADGPYQRSIGAVSIRTASSILPSRGIRVRAGMFFSSWKRRWQRGALKHASIIHPWALDFDEEPLNLELAGAGPIPNGWRATNLSDGSYAVSIADGQLPAGGNAMRIAREPGALPWGDVTLSQFFPAARWRGRRMVFTAAMRAQLLHIGTGAHIVIRVFSDDPSVQPRVAAQPAGPVRSSHWAERSVAIDVPSEANWIEISLVLAGSGSAWFGGLQLSGVESTTLPAGRLQFSKKTASRDRQLAPPGVSLGPELTAR